MFCTPEYAAKITGRNDLEVTLDAVLVAQEIIEAYVGRVESEVENANDLALLAKATAYQAVYLAKNGDSVFEQVALASVGQNNSLTVFKSGDFTAPWIAPLAVISCRKLSWNQSRSVHTGPISKDVTRIPWERD